MELNAKQGPVAFKLGFRALQGITAALECSLKDLGQKIDDSDLHAIEVITRHATGFEGETLEALLDEPGMLNQVRMAFVNEFTRWMGLADYAQEIADDEKKPQAQA
jgi:hypothetical protein